MNTEAILAQGALLGLSSGLACLAGCAPVLLPVMAGNANKDKSQLRLLAEYLAGRLAGYLLFALLAWLGTHWLLGATGPKPFLEGLLDLCLAALLLAYYFQQSRAAMAAQGPAVTSHSWWACLVSPWKLSRRLQGYRLLPLALGFVSGLSLCPPFVAALAKAGIHSSISGALLFFLTFFAATSLFFLPFPLLGAELRRPGAGQVARFACLLIALYLAYSGISALGTSFLLA